MPKPTPFHSRTAELVESHDWQIWSGFLSANAYELEHTHEYNAVRTSAAVFDISPLYKYYIDGPDAAALLDRILTRDVSKLRVGQVAYTTWCDDDGKIIDDGTVARLDENLYRLTAADPTQMWLEDNTAGMNVHVEEVTEPFGGVSIQGPTSRDILTSLSQYNIRNTEYEIRNLKYFRLIQTDLAGIPVVLSRTGYTGDLGYEMFVERHDALALWDKLMEVGEAYNLRPMGNTALDMTRIEAGLLLTDVDFVSSKKTMFDHQKSTPFELGLGWTVKLDKPYFVGQAALKKEHARGSKEVTVGLELDIPGLEQLYARFGMPLHLPYASETDSVPLYADARHKRIGKSTSRTWSPILKKYIAIARVEPRYATLGTRVFVEVTIEAHRLAVPAKVVEMPFFDPPRKRG